MTESLPIKLALAALLIAALSMSGCAGAPAAGSPQPGSPTAVPSAPTATAVSGEPQPALEAQLQGPRGLAFDNDGNFYVAECMWTYAAIDKIDPDGMVTRFAGTGKPGFSGDGGPATAAELFCATGIAVGPDGAVYFADHINNRIRRVDAAGTITTFAGSGPTGLDLGSFSGDGGPATEATLQEPWGVAFDQAGRLNIADRDNVRVRRVEPSGVITTVAGTGRSGSTGDGGPAIQAKICAPVGVAIDPAGNLVIPDACTTAIRVVDGNGTITPIAQTDSTDTSPDFASEGNAIFDSNGSMFVQAGPRVFNIDSTGVATPVAGNGSVGAPIDGSSAVEGPLPVEIWGLAADTAGNLYVADGATSVWLIDMRGIITRFAGRP